MKLESLVIAGQQHRGECVPEPCTRLKGAWQLMRLGGANPPPVGYGQDDTGNRRLKGPDRTIVSSMMGRVELCVYHSEDALIQPRSGMWETAS